jgi:hypothetical protein
VAKVWGRTQQHRPGAPRQHQLELGDPLVEHARVDQRRGEDPPGVVVAPVLVQPLVEGVDGDLGEHRVVDQPLLDQARQRGEHQRGGDPLLVQQREPGPGLAERGEAGHRRAGELAQRPALGVVAGVEGHVGPGPGDDLERRVGDELGEPVADHQLLAPPDLDEKEQVAVPLGQVPGQGVLGLVEVVVGVEDGETRVRFHAGMVITQSETGVVEIGTSLLRCRGQRRGTWRCRRRAQGGRWLRCTT